MSEFELIKSDTIASLLEDRHILDDDIVQVIKFAEKSGEKLYQPEDNIFLAKLRISEATFYVQYSCLENGYEIHTAYFHRSEIMEEE